MVLPNPWMVFPFALLLLSIAAAPLLAPQWWRRHYPKIALGLGAITLAYYFLALRAPGAVLETAHEYTSFIVLIGSLFVVSAGIRLQINRQATPLMNTIFLLAGALAANVLGTTGASMLLIQPWLQMNRERIRGYHLAFFIFLVANVGGCLTPIGDPPLFLGYLQGVPFWWIAQKCWPAWALAVGLLSGIFYLLDRSQYSKTKFMPEDGPEGKKWRISGLPNLFFLAVILGAVFLTRPLFLREAVMLSAALGSYWLAHKRTSPTESKYDLHPIIEIAILFAGIFATMIPALDLLKVHARAILGANPQPDVFYWSTGVLSAVLDNAPTYLGILNALLGTSGAGDLSGLLAQNARAILAISLGAVFFGAATYIGNGPNFMVKAIADRQKIPTPHFLEYIGRYTLPFLLPVLVAVWLVFFR
jgi:Na+/H+ antiporter NhaD/arsenite permease-like protein